jgi:hypothetical protein
VSDRSDPHENEPEYDRTDARTLARSYPFAEKAYREYGDYGGIYGGDRCDERGLPPAHCDEEKERADRDDGDAKQGGQCLFTGKSGKPPRLFVDEVVYRPHRVRYQREEEYVRVRSYPVDGKFRHEVTGSHQYGTGKAPYYPRRVPDVFRCGAVRQCDEHDTGDNDPHSGKL